MNDNNDINNTIKLEETTTQQGQEDKKSCFLINNKKKNDQELWEELAKMDSVSDDGGGFDLIQRERMFEEPSESEVQRELNRMESREERALLNEIITRFTEPVKYKLKFYQIWVLVYIDQLVTLFVNKLLVLRGQLSNRLPDPNKTLTSTHLKIVQFQQTQIKLDLFSKENLERTRVLVYKLNLKAVDKFGELQSMHHHCVTHQETPDLFCEPFIHKGFRPINQPYSYYAKSLFTKHNETINAWSHYLGAVYTTYCAFHYDFSDPYSWPILICLITSTIMFVCSATAHLMHQKSHYCHMTCFLCDFGGISFNAFGSALMQVYFVSPVWYYKLLEPYLLPIIGFQSVLCILMNAYAQTSFKRPYPPAKRFFQFAPCGLLWTFTMLPLVVNYFWPDPDYQMHINFSAHMCHVGVFMLGAFFFAYDFPQRYFPGKLDFFGQGHNLFHLCVFAVVYLHLEACYADFSTNKAVIRATREPPTLAYSFGSLIALIVYYFYVIKLFTKMIAHNFDEQGNLIKTKKRQSQEEEE